MKLEPIVIEILDCLPFGDGLECHLTFREPYYGSVRTAYFNGTEDRGRSIAGREVSVYFTLYLESIEKSDIQLEDFESPLDEESSFTCKHECVTIANGRYQGTCTRSTEGGPVVYDVVSSAVPIYLRMSDGARQRAHLSPGDWVEVKGRLNINLF